MADVIDMANDLIDSEVSRALNKIRKNTSNDKACVKFCLECGEEIPLPRQKLGFKYCVPCAEEKERRQALFAD